MWGTKRCPQGPVSEPREVPPKGFDVRKLKSAEYKFRKCKKLKGSAEYNLLINLLIKQLHVIW